MVEKHIVSSTLPRRNQINDKNVYDEKIDIEIDDNEPGDKPDNNKDTKRLDHDGLDDDDSDDDEDEFDDDDDSDDDEDAFDDDGDSDDDEDEFDDDDDSDDDEDEFDDDGDSDDDSDFDNDDIDSSASHLQVSDDFRSGFVTVAGLPNAGKSTLINSFFETSPMITSWKPQTTRFHVRCISTNKERQIIFVDTPGWHCQSGNLEKYMLNEIKRGLDGIDVLLFLIDISVYKIDKAIAIYKEAVATTTGVGWKIIALSKVDLIKRDKLLPLLEKIHAECECDEMIPISSLKGENLDSLEKAIFAHLPRGPQFYPEDVTVDKPDDFVFSEFIREQIHRMTHAEVPFSTAVEVNDASETDDEIFIDASIYVERDSQKGILIGHKGTAIKLIKTRARSRIARFTGKKVHMTLKVKVADKWTKSPLRMKYLGYI
jgi:GTP-binding protein Era